MQVKVGLKDKMVGMALMEDWASKVTKVKMDTWDKMVLLVHQEQKEYQE